MQERLKTGGLQLSRRKKILFSLILASILYGLAETVAYLSYRAVFHAGLPLKKSPESKEEQDYALQQFFDEEQTKQARKQTRAAAYRIEVLHPYLGFVRDPDVLDDVSIYGFPLGTVDGHLFKRSDKQVLIGIFGGSVAEQLARDGAGFLQDELLSHPFFSGKEIKIIPFAMGGYKQPQQLLTLNYLLVLGGELDFAVNVDGYNEVVLAPLELFPQGAFYAYPRLWPNRFSDVMDPEVRSALGEYEYLKKRRHALYESFSRFPFRHSALINWIWKARDNRLNWAMAESQRTFLEYRSAQTSYLKTGPQNPFSGEKQEYEALAELWARSSIQMHHLCLANHIRYFHFLQPNQYVEGSKPMTEAEKNFALSDEMGGPLAKKGYLYLIERGRQLADQGTPFYDLTRLFIDIPEIIYRDSCCHYNETGNALLAEAIANRIKESIGLQPASP
jgi:hypothetical protein